MGCAEMSPVAHKQQGRDMARRRLSVVRGGAVETKERKRTRDRTTCFNGGGWLMEIVSPFGAGLATDRPGVRSLAPPRAELRWTRIWGRMTGTFRLLSGEIGTLVVNYFTLRTRKYLHGRREDHVGGPMVREKHLWKGAGYRLISPAIHRGTSGEYVRLGTGLVYHKSR